MHTVIKRDMKRNLVLTVCCSAEGDRVIVQAKNPLLSKPLKRDHKLVTGRGTLEHNDIIGKRSRDKIQAHKGGLPHFQCMMAPLGKN